MTDKYYHFTSARTLPERFKTAGRYSEIILGAVGDDTFPTTLRVLKVNQRGDTSVLREFTAFPDNRNILLETSPGSTIDIECVGAVDLYVELNDLSE